MCNLIACNKNYNSEWDQSCVNINGIRAIGRNIFKKPQLKVPLSKIHSQSSFIVSAFTEGHQILIEFFIISHCPFSPAECRNEVNLSIHSTILIIKFLNKAIKLLPLQRTPISSRLYGVVFILHCSTSCSRRSFHDVN